MLYIFKFFTTWVAILTIFHKYSNHYISLPFLTYFVMTAGLYLSFIHPGYFIIYKGQTKQVIRDPQKFILVDLPFHIGLFYFVYNTYGLDCVPDDRILASIILIFLYIIICDAPKVYGVHIFEMMIVSMASLLSYVILCRYKQQPTRVYNNEKNVT
jgi:hypothetical protein